MPSQHIIDNWFTILDKIATTANLDLRYLADHCKGDDATDVLGSGLLAIASQLAYGNAVAAAEFYMRFETPMKETP